MESGKSVLKTVKNEVISSAKGPIQCKLIVGVSGISAMSLR